MTQATEVDHIIPHKGNQELFWDESNWQPLCHSCHSKKTAREDGGYGHAQRQHRGTISQQAEEGGGASISSAPPGGTVPRSP